MQLCAERSSISYFLLILAIALLADNRQVEAEETRTLPTIETGAHFFAGPTETSLTGARAYPLIFRAEAIRGKFRPSVAAEFFYSAGTASVGASSTSYTLYGGSFTPAYNIFMFREGYFQPFFGVGGILGWNYLKLTTPPASVEAYTQGYSYGYELSSGVDIRFARAESSALRLRASMTYLVSRIAGQSAFALGGFRFVAGFVY